VLKKLINDLHFPKLLFCVLGITKGKKEINEIEYSLEVPDDFRNALINIKKNK